MAVDGELEKVDAAKLETENLFLARQSFCETGK